MLLLLAACSPDDASAGAVPAACLVEGDRPAGWGEATHGDDADPDYGTVFDRAAVLEVTITVAADDHAAMYDELTTLLGGAFGEGAEGGPGEGMPDRIDAAEACAGLAEGDACTVPLDGLDTAGSCAAMGPEGELACMPEGGPASTIVEEDPSYVPVTVAVGDAAWCYAGMRFKGNSTLSQTWSAGVAKLPFRLDFDRFEDAHPEVDDQRFYGFTDLSFGNNMGDGTYARDVMASTVLEDRGVPAARNRFAAVALDAGEGPVYLGLYTLAEDPSDALAERVWGDDDGNLYEGDGICADLVCYDAASFEAKTNDETADGAEVQALVDALAADRDDDAAWRAALEATLDVDAFLRWLAVNAAIENWDTYGVMTHNYYLYALPDAGIQWIPWDHNLSLMEGYRGEGDPLYDDVSEEWPLIRHTLDDATYADAYRLHLADALDGAYEEEAFIAAAEAHRALIEPYVLAEIEGSTFVASEGAWDAAWDELYGHVASRRAEVEEALQQARLE